MNAEILATGDEIRTGALVDSNSAHIAEVLTMHGLEVTRHHAVGDNLNALTAILVEIAGRTDVAIVTGGLGPTRDDLTAEAMARAAGCELQLNDLAMETVTRFFRERKRTMNASNRKQAYLPQHAEVLDNPVGTAPGFVLKIDKCTFFCLPGVPYEMKKMLKDQVLPHVAALSGGVQNYCRVHTLSTFGFVESAVGEKLSGLETLFPDITVGLRAKFPEIQIKLYWKGSDEPRGMQTLEAGGAWVAEQMGDRLFSTGDQTMAAVVGDLLVARNASLAVAESCTGGLISNWLTNTPGSSNYFLMSAVTYANSAKMNILGVSADTLNSVGAVHEKTAEEMACGARRAAGADFGLATTGIAGPDGGTDEKPVGTVCIAVAGPEQTLSKRYLFAFGRRLMNKRIFAMAALDMLRRVLLNLPVL
jgi:nicotinamide-nucleotide amidase